MDVYINLSGRHLEKQQHDRKYSRRHDVAISVSQRVLNQPIANQTAVDENKNRVAIELLNLRLRNETMKTNFSRLQFLDLFRIAPPGRRLWQPNMFEWLFRRQRNQLIQCLLSKHLIHALAMAGHRRRDQQCVRSRMQLEMLLRMRQRVVRYQ